MRRLIPVLLCAVLTQPGLERPAAAARVKPTPAATEKSVPATGDTSRVHIGPAAAGSEAFVAWPAGRDPAPAVVVLHEWWGLDAHIRDIAKRLAGQGYVAVVPDLYRGQLADDPERARALKQGLSDDDAFTLADGAVRWLRAEPRTAKSRVGVVGFCMGGALAERWALRGPGLAAVVMYYGSPVTDPDKLAPLEAPLQGHFGADDPSIPQAQVDSLRAGLAKAGKSVDIHVYPGAGHAFMHDGRDTYRPDAARQAWARTLAFLQEHLKGR